MLAMWTLVNPRGESPDARAEHALTNSDDGSKLFLYGGQTSNTAFNDLWQFDIATSTWTRLASSSPAPGKRWGATLSFYQNTLYLFGGEEVREDSYHHLWAYDLNQNKWFIPEQSGTAPTPRSNHTTTRIPISGGEGLLVYGGKCINSGRELADCQVFNLASKTWYNPFYAHAGREPDEIPPGRKRHTAVLAGNKLVVFAGWQGNRNAGSYWDDLYYLDLVNWTWEYPRLRGTSPTARAGHVSAFVNGKVFVWGGWGAVRGTYAELFYLELDDSTWSSYRRGKPPTDRFDMAGTAIGPKLWIFGGQLDTGNNFSNQLYVANLGSIY